MFFQSFDNNYFINADSVDFSVNDVRLRAIYQDSVIVVNLGINDKVINDAAEKLYEDLQAAGLEVLLDDRDERPGFKFKDADLIGIPYRVTVGKTFSKKGLLEIKHRKDGTTEELAPEETVKRLQTIILAELAQW